jgi:uncharacterized membrane-anchored protein YitT (DUF2179 family)
MNKPLVIVAVILGIIFLVLAYVYFTTAASALPAFLPGHQAGLMTHHYKHGIGTLILGIACFIFAWFQSGKKKTSASSNEEKNG